MDHTSLCCHLVRVISFSKINDPFPFFKPVFDKTVKRNDVLTQKCGKEAEIEP